MKASCISIVLLLATIASGCSIPIAPYNPSYDNVKLLREVKAKADVTPMMASSHRIKSINVRGSGLESPYHSDLVNYIETALKQELEKAGILDPGSNTQISAIIDENDINTGSSIGTGTIAATFKITKLDSVLYEKRIKINEEWESSFMGALAIPRAAESYPKMVQTLLNRLFSDGDFVAALSQ